MKAKKKQKSQLVQSRRLRYEECTRELKAFDDSLRKWPVLAKKIMEVEQEELYSEGGYKSVDEWIRSEAQASYRLCYMVKARYKALSPHFSDKELLEIPSQTADWASKTKNISPSAFTNPKVRKALLLPKQKAIKELQERVPEQAIEAEERITCKFAVSQHEAVQEAYQAFKYLKDEGASFEDFIEYIAAEWFDSVMEDGGTFREQWERFKSVRGTVDTAPEARA